jgi:hypothetical protein
MNGTEGLPLELGIVRRGIDIMVKLPGNEEKELVIFEAQDEAEKNVRNAE